MKVTYKINGREVSQEEWDKVPIKGFGSTSVSTAYSRGLRSRAAGIHSSQVAEFREHLKREGITGVSYDNNGDVIFTSRAGRKKFLKHRGMQDNDGGYGD